MGGAGGEGTRWGERRWAGEGVEGPGGGGGGGRGAGQDSHQSLREETSDQN